MGKKTVRIAWIDASKGFGIFCIVLGHILPTCTLKSVLYSFHVPLFFFLSGIVFHSDEKPLTDLISKRAKGLLLPYYLFAYLSLLLFMGFGYLTEGSLSGRLDDSVGKIALMTLFGYSSANRPLWFLPCLMLAEIAMWGCIKLEKRVRNVIFFRIALLACCVVFSTAYMKIGAVKIPFHPDKVLALFPFYYGGYFLKKFLNRSAAQKQESKWELTVYAGLLLLCGVALTLLRNGEPQYWTLTLGRVSVFYLSAFMTIFGICLLFMLLPGHWTVFSVGRATLPILLMHKFPILFFQTMCPYVKDRLEEGSILWSILITFVTIIMCMTAMVILQKILPEVIGMKRQRKNKIVEVTETNIDAQITE